MCKLSSDDVLCEIFTDVAVGCCHLFRFCEPSFLGLIYDLTPAEFVTALVTEVGIISSSFVKRKIDGNSDEQSVLFDIVQTRNRFDNGLDLLCT